MRSGGTSVAARARNMMTRFASLAATAFLLAPITALAQPVDGVSCNPAATDPLCALAETLEEVATRRAPCVEGAVTALLRDRVADGELSAADVKDAFGAAAPDGSTTCEMAEIRAALRGGRYTITADARAAAIDGAYEAGLWADSLRALSRGKTYGGTPIPDEVRALIATAKLHGAVVYDVEATDADGEGIYSHYPATAPATGNMAFSYTEITPAALAADAALTGPQTRITGEEDRRNADGTTFKAVTYGTMNGGSGSISANYDEAWHDDLYARGRSGDKWANNFAILSDGSVHCLPAARRSDLQDVILTNPALSRGQQMMFNGHLDVRNGVVVGVEMSGILSKRAARGRDVFVDPIAVLKAWGFRIAPNVEVHYGNVERGVPTRNETRAIIGAAP